MGLFLKDGKLTGAGWLGITLVAGGFTVCIMRAGGGSETGKKIEAHIICQNFVKDRLKAPASAKFPAWDSSNDGAVRIKKENDGSYQVRGHVDAKNAYGTMLRKNYTCHVKPADGEKWELLELSM